MPLIRVGEAGNWLPVSISRLDALLSNRIVNMQGYGHTYALRRNIAYSLQHLEFLEQCLVDLKLTSVLITQTWKTGVIVGCGVIESLLHYLIVTSGNQSTTDWETKQEFAGSSKTVEGKVYRIDSVVKEKLTAPQPVRMTFDAMIKKSESKRLLGRDHGTYAKLRRLRPLRNRVHLQQIAQPVDHDYNAFTLVDYKLMMQLVHAIFTGPIFAATAEQRRYFDYLERHV